MICDDLLGAIGNTPTVRVRRMLPESAAGTVYLKLEGMNPTLSIKDRSALTMILDAESSGKLRAGMTILDSSSGNLGKSLAMVGIIRGYQVVIVIDEKTPRSVLGYYKALGATTEIVKQPDKSGSFQRARLNRVRELLKGRYAGAFWTNQYDNPSNAKAHETKTASEIIGDFPQLDYLVAAVSTGGHLAGLSRGLRERYPHLQVVACDAEGSTIFGGQFHPYLTNGIGLSWTPGNIRDASVKAVIHVRDADAFSAARLLAQKEAILAGGSAGAVTFACLGIASLVTKPATILGILPDHGVSYLSDFYSDRWIAKHHLKLVRDVEALRLSAFAACSRVLDPTGREASQ